MRRPEFVIVGVQVHHGLEAADFGEALFGRGHRRTHHEFQPFEFARDERRAAKRRRGAHAIHGGDELQIVPPAIERGHAADAGIAEHRRDASQISRLDSHVAIGDDQQIVPRLAHQAAKIGNLGVRAEPLRDHNQANGPPGKIRDQFLHDRARPDLRHRSRQIEFQIPDSPGGKSSQNFRMRRDRGRGLASTR